jgi:RNA polymerase sigma-70 factor, ECF subfamily
MSSSPQSLLQRMGRNESRWRSYLDDMCKGDTQALAKLYDETASVVFGLALRVISDRADAEETVLDIYQQLWNARHTFDANRGTVWGWMVTMTRNRAIDRLRASASRRGKEAPLDAGWETPCGNPAPEQETIFQQERKLIQEALARLAPEQRQAIELSFFRGLTHMEVADTLGVPLGTIKTRIRTGMRRLRETLAPLGFAEGIN